MKDIVRQIFRSFSRSVILLFTKSVLKQEEPDDDDYCNYDVDADGVYLFFARAFRVEWFFVRGFVGEAAARVGDQLRHALFEFGVFRAEFVGEEFLFSRDDYHRVEQHKGDDEGYDPAPADHERPAEPHYRVSGIERVAHPFVGPPRDEHGRADDFGAVFRDVARSPEAQHLPAEDEREPYREAHYLELAGEYQYARRKDAPEEPSALKRR